ncbi:restriction endonuclease subunit M [Rothia nasimurium]|uniref:site-specific DNA-methyltransferase (adenine-specific) n=2 Tax=Rothia nasimurium TaxID=85336 RepID=A0A4Y9F6L6_9MICC|nr:N-6 DNA methylase [Rothia nasimurium]TFU23428.1 restriction endonuclease subunit M [Rothia nasimurium]
MITKSNLKTALLSLGFEQCGKKLYGVYNPLRGEAIEVDFEAEKIVYPETLRVNEKQTTNFSHPENFVVLECVFRLLQKGYRPEHIELEKRWKLGHEAKGGRADICVYDANGENVITIIECKTPGAEYNREYRKILADGGQLFSYRQQEGSAQWLCLYTTDFIENSVVHQAEVIPVFDDPEKKKQKLKDGTITLYQEATTVSQLFSVWKETYGQLRRGDLIFNSEASAYNVQVLPLRKKYLKEFSESDASKIVNQFEEILRHNNVSDKENAFNKLIALFICKLVDEYEKTDNDIVDFQYRLGVDTYENLQDRLQLLHKKGMEEFMKEEMFYVSSAYPEELFKNYTKENRKKAIEDLSEVIRKLKYYSNNDFAFKDVHNEELFLQNSKVLIEVVQLFERHRIVYPSKHQFLGDLFEQLLNKGFKQNEGQFFTPMPITRFIWDSLPLERFVQRVAENKYPRIIDYACGSGHFLTEAVSAVNSVLGADVSTSTQEEARNNQWVRNHIHGIEKDYRLARVSKVSLFMNGAGEGTIVFGDGLDNHPDQGINNHHFDILVANPPYSVKAFKQHLHLTHNTSQVIHAVSDTGGEIETLFIERMAQLLKAQGLAAIILPSSFLTNEPKSYAAAREVLMKNFMIRAVVQLGSKTFAATGTNTVVLFLEKYTTPPEQIHLIDDTVQSILSGADLAGWDDEAIFSAYLSRIHVAEDEYRAIVIDQNATVEYIEKIDYFKNYWVTFNDSKAWIDFTKKKIFKELSKDEKEQRRLIRFYTHARTLEQEKLRYFALSHNCQTLVITAPSENKLQKEFLGYDWSNRKGSEGIKIIKPGGMLYDEKDRQAPGTLAAAIRTSFAGQKHEVSTEKKKYLSFIDTSELFNFSRPSFANVITLTADKKISVNSVYPLITLGKLVNVDIRKGETITQQSAGEGDVKVVAGGKQHAYLTDKANREAHVITVSASGANAGYVNYWAEPIFASDCTTIQASERVTTRWVFFYLKFIQEQIISTLQRGAAQPHVYPWVVGSSPTGRTQ